MKEMLIVSFRWIGASLLPLPVAMLVRLFILYVMPSSVCRYMGTDGEWWFCILPYLCPFVEGAAAVMCTYSLAPRSKFFATCIITAVYATIPVVGLAIGLVLGSFQWQAVIKVAILLVGMGCGIANAFKCEIVDE